jgi:hypothetical protein
LLHRGDLFSDIQLHVFLHGIWGNRTRGELKGHLAGHRVLTKHPPSSPRSI